MTSMGFAWAPAREVPRVATAPATTAPGRSIAVVNRCLVVPSDSDLAESPQLVEQLRRLAVENPAMQCVVLLPARPKWRIALSRLELRDAKLAARERAQGLRRRLEAAGVRVLAARVGDTSPMQAIDDELWGHPREYDSLAICTTPPRRGDPGRVFLRRGIEARFGLPVIHLVTQVPAKPTTAS